MGDPRGFIKVKRETAQYRPVCERVRDYGDVSIVRTDEASMEQASRCMDCGTPFCHWACPLGNYIPEWNDLVYHGRWRRAFELLDATNNMPEITGRVCPAQCEYGCTLDLNDEPVTIRENELAIIEHAYKNRIVKPRKPAERTGKKICVVGSGPAGLASADQLNRAGHLVTVFEKDIKIGGILRYGIPDFKLEKSMLDRRISIFEKEGIMFKTGVEVGRGTDVKKLLRDFDAVCLAIGSRVPRDLNIEGRDLNGIYFAMDYLVQSNKRICGEDVPKKCLIDAKGKKVVVIGGGDTGSDCVGTAHRQGARCVVQVELLPQPCECRTDVCPWPGYPMLLKTSTSHQEGGERHWSVLTKRFVGERGKVKRLECVKVSFSKAQKGTAHRIAEVNGSEFSIDADMVIIAVGFVSAEDNGLLSGLGLQLDSCGRVKAGDDYMTSVKGVFSAGDARRGQSLVVWAISEGRRAAHSIDKYLMGRSVLPNM
ncbi:MAG: glutamate synthase subunit beta [Candidatus Omnitrophica bacterium]|nr:glutamate synthase subunit beta [Candidatus Omnitrophota bacterium]